MVLLLVILILALVSVLVLAWAREWRMELKLTGNFRAVHQSRRLAEAGVYYALGKLVATKMAESSPFSGLSESRGALWRGDQQTHVLEFPDGRAEITLEDEAGKINLNRSPPDVLRSLFTVIGSTEPQLSIMVDSIEDWRSRGNQPHPYGAKSDYYLGLNPPYVAKNGKFDVVEELAWVRGFEASPLLPHLGRLLTVQEDKKTGNSVNVNTAPLEVLRAVGFPPDVCQSIIKARQNAPLTNLQEGSPIGGNPLLGGNMPSTFQTSPFFTIISRGQATNQGGRYAIKAIVRMDVRRDNPWEIISWFDGFPISQ